MPSIRLSPKHGVNPSMGQCFYCLKEDGTIVLPGQLNMKDEEAPRLCIWSMEPCPECKRWMEQGIILVGVTTEAECERVASEHEDHRHKYGYLAPAKRPLYIPNPERSGRFAVIKDAAFSRIIDDPALVSSILRCRWCFIPTPAWDAMKIPLNKDSPHGPQD